VEHHAMRVYPTPDPARPIYVVDIDRPLAPSSFARR